MEPASEDLWMTKCGYSPSRKIGVLLVVLSIVPRPVWSYANPLPERFELLLVPSISEQPEDGPTTLVFDQVGRLHHTEEGN